MKLDNFGNQNGTYFNSCQFIKVKASEINVNGAQNFMRHLSYLLGSSSEAAERSSRAARCFPKVFRQVARRMRDFTCVGSIQSALVQSDCKG